MHKITLISGLLSVMCISKNNAQTAPEFTGRLSPEQLFSEPLKTWFVKPERSVMPDSALMQKNHDDLKAFLVLGTWCDDSHRYVPEILDYLSHLPGFKDLEIYAVGRDKQCSACPEAVKPERIPLLVLYRNGEEIGRMAEGPPSTVKSFLDATLSRP